MLLILRYYYIRAVHDCTSLILRKISFYISCLYSHCCLYAYVYIILTPYEYYMILPALAINVASKPRLATSALHTALLSNSIIYISVQYTLLCCAIMTVLSLRKIQFYISGQYHAEVADAAVCTPDFAVLPSALSGSPH